MSRENDKINQNFEFTARFIEACGTAEPAKLQRLLNISYQAAKNYLNGRTPEVSVLKTVALKTPYSLHWLLTGEGEKFVSKPQTEDTLLLTGQIRALVREECVSVINEILEGVKPAQQKVVVLQTDQLISETIHEPTSKTGGSEPISQDSLEN